MAPSCFVWLRHSLGALLDSARFQLPLEMLFDMRNLRPIFFHGLLFLVFIQLLTDFIAAIYAFGLLGTSIPPELAAVVLLFSPIMLVFMRQPSLRSMSFLLGVVWWSRLFEPMLDTRWRMMVSGIGVSAWLLLFPMLWWHEAHQRKSNGPRVVMLGVMFGVAVSILFRVWGSGVDISVLGWGQVLGWGMAMSGMWLWYQERERYLNGHPQTIEDKPSSFVVILALMMGLVAVWVLMYFSFSAPYVISR